MFASLLQIIMVPMAPIPDPVPVQPPGTEGISTVLGWAKWVGLGVCVLGLIIAGAMMAIQSRRGQGEEHLGRIAGALGGVIIIGAAASLIGFLAGGQ